MRILFCDDNPDDRKKWLSKLDAVWKILHEKDVVSEKLELETCADISDAPLVTDARSVKDLSGFDGFLLDILWGDDEKAKPHGIEIAELIRAEYPEKPILMFTSDANPENFNRLIKIGICGYLRKGEKYETLCFQIHESMERARKARRGQCLFKQIRQLTSTGKGWSADSVGKAASAVWQHERSYDRWEAFWDAFAEPMAQHRLTSVFNSMRNFFGESDLITLGTMPGMRGHLDHVLNVYFTGYVISNTNPKFKELAISSARRFFPSDHAKIDENQDYYWDLFQLSWLAAATLHDTAYPLEVLPDILVKCNHIKNHFSEILDDSSASSDWLNSVPSNGLIETQIDNLSKLLLKLDDEIPLDFIRTHCTFPKGGSTRVNHGVASALLFLNEAEPLASLAKQPPELITYLRWASVAMAMHSLKIPGSKAKKIKITLNKDPLSYLLMVCDEIQIWERERPDSNKMKSPIKDTELVEFKISSTQINARIDYLLYDETIDGARFAEMRNEMNEGIEKDGEILQQYIDGSGIKITVNQGIASPKTEFSKLCF